MIRCWRLGGAKIVNKLIIGILVFLVIVVGGLCFYTYTYTQTLSQQISYLSEQLTVFQQKQAARIDTLSEELTALNRETTLKFGVLEEEMGEASRRLATLETEIGDIAAAFSPSVINAREVYQKARHAIVRISNGKRTVGSGFVLDAQAHVVTAHHVTENLANIYVILSDGNISPATVIGSCQYSDVAVLSLQDKPVVEPLVLADSATVQIGEPVVTIGNPFDLTETLTSGIVSQINRYVEIETDAKTRWVANLIQFDAAANFGNSGGPLLNAAGAAIGMVIARIKPDEGDGIYYAVSANKIRVVAASLIERGSFDYPWLGVEVTNLNPQTAQDRELETTNGALVRKVFADSPAEAAEIKVDDIIVAIDRVAVREVADLTSFLGEHKTPGEVATLELMRGTTKMELSVKIGKRD